MSLVNKSCVAATSSNSEIASVRCCMTTEPTSYSTEPGKLLPMHFNAVKTFIHDFNTESQACGFKKLLQRITVTEWQASELQGHILATWHICVHRIDTHS